MAALRLQGAAVLAVLAVARHAHAEPSELRYDLRVDIPLTAATGLGFVLTEALRGSIAPAACRWCDRNADGSDGLNGLDAGVRSALRWSDTSAANTVSNVTAFALSPLLAYGLPALLAAREGRLGAFPVDALVITEAVALVAALNQVVKFSAARARPFVHAATVAAPMDSDNNLSFFSGHTSFAFALAVSSATVATMRGYSYAGAVWAAGLSVAAFTGYLRIAADRHYFTDVLVGALAGGGLGFLVPWLLHRPAAAPSRVSLAVLPVPGGAMLALSIDAGAAR
jgi:membrane-associated phospholipid phosphatase